jgi:hypothetical protein
MSETTKDKLYIDKLKSYFKDRTSFENKEIISFYRKAEPKVKPTTVNWRIYALVQSGILARVGRGKFTLGEGRHFIPTISANNKSLYNKLRQHLPYLPVCIWNTSILNEFMVHQLGKFFTIIEVEKDAMESVFHFFKENNINAFLNPDSDVLNNYAIGEKNPVIIKPLVSEAPVQEVNEISTVTIEKILVDIFSDDVLFAAEQGSELENIFREAMEKYTVNESRMVRYADRKRKKESFSNYLNKVSKFRNVKLNGHKA